MSCVPLSPIDIGGSYLFEKNKKNHTDFNIYFLSFLKVFMPPDMNIPHKMDTGKSVKRSQEQSNINIFVSV